MFAFVIRYLGFLKHVPVLPFVFDIGLRLYSLLFRRQVVEVLDEVEEYIMQWDGVTATLHKYGGVQFNYKGKELGHIHGNGLVDILFSRTVKEELIASEIVQPHHVFKNSGWVSYYIQRSEDFNEVVALFRRRYNSVAKNNK